MAITPLEALLAAHAEKNALNYAKPPKQRLNDGVRKNEERSFKAGHQSLAPLLLKLAEALEESECYCEESLPVNDILRNVTCHRCDVLTSLTRFLEGEPKVEGEAE